jgi:hypothetical protein
MSLPHAQLYWGKDGGQGRPSCLWLLSGHTWEDGGEEAGTLNDDAGHVQHQLCQVRQAAHRTRLGQDGGQGRPSCFWLLSGHTWEDGGEEAGTLNDDAGHVQHQLCQVRQAASRTRLGQDGGQGRPSCFWLLSGHTWEDGGEEAGPLYDDAGHVQHQLGQVSQAARRTRLGQEPDTFINLFYIPFFLGRNIVDRPFVLFTY